MANIILLFCIQNEFYAFLFLIQNTLGYTTDCSIPFGCKNTKKFQMELFALQENTPIFAPEFMS